MDILFDGSADDGIAREMAELELALLRRGVDRRAAGRECCSRCGRTPLLGERVYTLDERGTWACELCRALGGGQALGSRVVHGPAFGHSIRIVDQRAA
jgi:ribosomal protein L37AE/L43A